VQDSLKKILVFGNSGAGKSTLAKQLAAQYHISHLDLDEIAWEPEQEGVRRAVNESGDLLLAFTQQHTQWVIEGCQGSLLELAAQECNELHFLNPGVEVCQQNNRQRPWEAHKYPSPEAQDKNLDMLQAWVANYAQRYDEYSLSAHRKVFDAFNGIKHEHHSNLNAQSMKKISE